LATEAGKKILLRLELETLALQEVLSRVRELQAQHPDFEVFYDGDEQAICSKPRPREP
jgi:hypothetical protein